MARELKFSPRTVLSIVQRSDLIVLTLAPQISAVTHYLDSSNVYGSSQQGADALREFQGGRLRVELKDGRQFPPNSNNKSALCDHISEEEACYLTGTSGACYMLPYVLGRLCLCF
jgi:hypothetical protein